MATRRNRRRLKAQAGCRVQSELHHWELEPTEVPQWIQVNLVPHVQEIRTVVNHLKECIQNDLTTGTGPISTTNITNVTNVAGDNLTEVINNINVAITNINNELDALGWPGVLDIDRNTGNALLGGHNPNVNTGDRMEFGNTLTHPTGGHITTDDDLTILGLEALPSTANLSVLAFDRGLNTLAIGNTANLGQLNLLSDVDMLQEASTGDLLVNVGVDETHNIGNDWQVNLGEDFTITTAEGDVASWDHSAFTWTLGSLTTDVVEQVNIEADTQVYAASNGAGDGVYLNAIGGHVRSQAAGFTRLFSALSWENTYVETGAGTFDNYTAGGNIGNITTVVLTGAGGTFSGIDWTVPGQVILFINGSESSWTFEHAGAGSDADNQFAFSGGADITLAHDETLLVIYDDEDPIQDRWKAVGGNYGGGAGGGSLQSWAQTLVIGNISGGTDPNVSTGDSLLFGDGTQPTAGTIRFDTDHTFYGLTSAAADAALWGYVVSTDTLAVGNTSALLQLNLLSADEVLIAADGTGANSLWLDSAGTVRIDADDDLDINLGDDLTVTSAEGDVAVWDHGALTWTLGSLVAGVVTQVNVSAESTVVVEGDSVGFGVSLQAPTGAIASVANFVHAFRAGISLENTYVESGTGSFDDYTAGTNIGNITTVVLTGAGGTVNSINWTGFPGQVVIFLNNSDANWTFPHGSTGTYKLNNPNGATVTLGHNGSCAYVYDDEDPIADAWKLLWDNSGSVVAASPAVTWAAVLTNGNISGGTDPLVSSGDALQFGDTPVGSITQFGAALQIENTSGNDIQVVTTSGDLITSIDGDIQLVANGIYVNTYTGVLRADSGLISVDSTVLHAGDVTWDDALTAGRTSGTGHNPQITTGASLEIGDLGENTISDASTNLRIETTNSNDLEVVVAGNAVHTTTGAWSATGDSTTLQVAAGRYISVDSGGINLVSDDDLDVGITDDITVSSPEGATLSWDHGLKTWALGSLTTDVVEQVNVLADTGVLIAANGNVDIDPAGDIILKALTGVLRADSGVVSVDATVLHTGDVTWNDALSAGPTSGGVNPIVSTGDLLWFGDTQTSSITESGVGSLNFDITEDAVFDLGRNLDVDALGSVLIDADSLVRLRSRDSGDTVDVGVVSYTTAAGGSLILGDDTNLGTAALNSNTLTTIYGGVNVLLDAATEHVRISGGLRAESYVAMSVTGTLNDWAVTSSDNVVHVRITTTGNTEITGIDGGAEGKIFILDHVAGDHELILRTEDIGSSAANRFLLSGDLDIALNEVVIIHWNGTISTVGRWRHTGQAAVSLLAAQTWAAVLSNGNTSGGTNPQVSTGDVLEIGDSAEGTIQESSGSLAIDATAAGGSLLLTADTNFIVSATSGSISIDAVAGAASFGGAGTTSIYSDSGEIDLTAGGVIDLNATGNVTIDGSAIIVTSVADLRVAAGDDLRLTGTGAANLVSGGAALPASEGGTDLGLGATGSIVANATGNINLQATTNIILNAFTGVLRANSGVVSVDATVVHTGDLGWGDVLGVDPDSGGINPTHTKDNPRFEFHDTDTALSAAEDAGGIDFYTNDTSNPNSLAAQIQAVGNGTTGNVSLQFRTGSIAALATTLELNTNAVLTAAIVDINASAGLDIDVTGATTIDSTTSISILPNTTLTLGDTGTTSIAAVAAGDISLTAGSGGVGTLHLGDGTETNSVIVEAAASVSILPNTTLTLGDAGTTGITALTSGDITATAGSGGNGAVTITATGATSGILSLIGGRRVTIQSGSAASIGGADDIGIHSADQLRIEADTDAYLRAGTYPTSFTGAAGDVYAAGQSNVFIEAGSGITPTFSYGGGDVYIAGSSDVFVECGGNIQMQAGTGGNGSITLTSVGAGDITLDSDDDMTLTADNDISIVGLGDVLLNGAASAQILAPTTKLGYTSSATENLLLANMNKFVTNATNYTTTGTQNAWSGPTGTPISPWAGASGLTLNGIAAPTGTAGYVTIIWIFNKSSGQTITVNHQSGSASAENQIITSTAAALSVTAGQGLMGFYDTNSSRWRLFKLT